MPHDAPATQVEPKPFASSPHGKDLRNLTLGENPDGPRRPLAPAAEPPREPALTLTRPGGLPLDHSDRTRSRKSHRYPVDQAIVGNDRLARGPVTAEVFETPLPEARRVFRDRGRSAYNCNVFHHRSYLVGVWGRFPEHAEFRERPNDQQDVVVMRKPVCG